MTIQVAIHQEQADQVATLKEKYAGMVGEELLRTMIEEEFLDDIVAVSSFGSESVVLLHMVSQIDPTVPVLFLNTGKLFGETLRYRDRLQAKLGLTDVRSLAPHPKDENERDKDGDLWLQDTDACCHFRKTLPLRRALSGFSAQITGRKRFQTDARTDMPMIEEDPQQLGMIKINPLANWSLDDLAAYIEKHNLPRHPLVKDGYLSIGCMPCTQRVKAGGDYRDGRWAGLDKDECGIHDGEYVDGGGI